jgi:hypothetical protein
MARVLSRLEGVRRLSEGYYESICPLGDCPDGRLLVVEGEDDRALIECDDGCWLSQIVPTQGLHAEDLFKSIDDIYIGTIAPKYEPSRKAAEEIRRRWRSDGNIPCPEGTPTPELPNPRMIR